MYSLWILCESHILLLNSKNIANQPCLKLRMVLFIIEISPSQLRCLNVSSQSVFDQFILMQSLFVNPQIRGDHQPVHKSRRAQNIHQERRRRAQNYASRLRVPNLSATRCARSRVLAASSFLFRPCRSRCRSLSNNVGFARSSRSRQDECKLCNGPWEMRDGAVYKSGSGVSTLAVIKSSRRLSSSPLYLTHTHAAVLRHSFMHTD